MKKWLMAVLVMLATAGCANVGKEFPTDQVDTITIGKTTIDQVRATFGEPWRVGRENGQKTWTYGKYKYSLFSDTQTTDLVIRFDDKGVVQAYNYNTTEHNE
ncbi:MAG: outer membrane protein assembly factor BamE [Ketobacteraceae bacterium]|nr:outer membrane protein assembly factor BamE [Ketobacteraceae bacterium]